MKKIVAMIHLFFKASMPYMVFLVLVMLLINNAKLRGIDNDIYNIQQNLNDIQRDVADLYNKSTVSQVDNSEVIKTIKAHHKVISQQIDDAERQIKANTVIWSK